MGRLALAGWPISGDHGPVGQAAVLTLLQQGDLAPAVPRLGGMARANGVVIVSERYWAFAGTDGSLREGRMPVAPRALRAIPLARGLVRLAGSLSPLFRRQGVARGRERLFLGVAIAAPPLTMEFWLLVARIPRLARVVLLPGLGLQRVTTREPTVDETRIALTALAAVLRRELAHG